MSHFSKDFNQFFIELAANNHKDWFDDNRKRYEQNIKKPFEGFVSDLVAALAVNEPEMNVDPKKTIFRINRDIRFAKDKTPYKLNRSAGISKFGKKDGGYPGFYFQMGPESIGIAGGAHHPDKDQLEAIRQAIMANPKKFRKSIETSEFKKVFGDLQGEENKRLPNKEMMSAAASEPLLLKKQLFYWAEFPAEMVTDPNLISFFIEKHEASKAYRDFLKAALA